jgi:hypothetical protein
MEGTTNRPLTRFEERLSIKIESRTAQEKSEKMRLLVAPFDEALKTDKAASAMWERISRLLKLDYDLHKDTIGYWSLLVEDDRNNLFLVTPLALHKN